MWAERTSTVVVALLLMCAPPGEAGAQTQADSVRATASRWKLDSTFHVRVRTPATTFVVDRPILVTSGFTYQNAATGPGTVPFEQILQIEIRRSQARHYAGLGAASAGAVGGVYGFLVAHWNNADLLCGDAFFGPCHHESVLGTVARDALGGALIGAIGGALIGSAVTRWKTVYGGSEKRDLPYD